MVCGMGGSGTATSPSFWFMERKFKLAKYSFGGKVILLGCAMETAAREVSNTTPLFYGPPLYLTAFQKWERASASQP